MVGPASARGGMITRFAPSPTGPLHLGHAYSALTVWRVAEQFGGTALLRIEDTDSTRCRQHFVDQIYDDLQWLGLDWPTPVRQQSQHTDDYEAALSRLAAMGLLYPCSCTRRDIIYAGAVFGSEGYVYPGTCINRTFETAKPTDAMRLNLRAAEQYLEDKLAFQETCGAETKVHHVDLNTLKTKLGDPVLRRKETGDPAYHLAHVVDDEIQSISHVVRGKDLWEQTPLHVLLHSLLGQGCPIYHHHDLITGKDGKRLAKISNSKSIEAYRQAGLSPSDVRAMVGYPASGTISSTS